MCAIKAPSTGLGGDLTEDVLCDFKLELALSIHKLNQAPDKCTFTQKLVQSICHTVCMDSEKDDISEVFL